MCVSVLGRFKDMKSNTIAQSERWKVTQSLNYRNTELNFRNRLLEMSYLETSIKRKTIKNSLFGNIFIQWRFSLKELIKAWLISSFRLVL